MPATEEREKLVQDVIVELKNMACDLLRMNDTSRNYGWSTNHVEANERLALRLMTAATRLENG